MSLTLEGLKIFCDVVRQRSFSRGAKMNGVSQSAASQTVSQIEKRLGVRLIDRSKRPLTLTQAGQAYYEGCLDLMSRYDALESEIQALHRQRVSIVNVASIYSVGLYDMTRYTRRFAELHPDSEVRIQYAHPQVVYERVLSEQCDLGLISFPRSMRELDCDPWRKEQMVVICSPTHAFASAARLKAERLDGENFVAFDNGLDVRRYIDRYLRRHGATVHFAMEFDNVEAIKRAVEVGSGVSILPEPTVRREVREGSLVALPLAGEPFVRPLGIIRRRGLFLSPAMASFIDLLTGKDIEPGEGQPAEALMKTQEGEEAPLIPQVEAMESK